MLKPLCTCQHNASTLSFLFKTGIWPSSACYSTYWLLHIKEVTQMCCHHCSLIARKYRGIVYFCCNIAKNHCRYCCEMGVAQSKWTKPSPANRQISFTFSGVVAGGLVLLLDRGSPRAGVQGVGWGRGTPASGGPREGKALEVLVAPTAPSHRPDWFHPISSGLGAQDAAKWLVLLVPIIILSVQAFGKEILRNNFPCVYSAFNWDRLKPGSLDPCLFSRTSS